MTRMLILSVALAVGAAAQTDARLKQLAAGKFLVSRRELPDPNFAGAVVLLVRYDEEGTMGLILNRRTEAPISRALEELKEAKGRSDPVYVGGPVQRTAVLGLLRSNGKPPESRHVFADVYLVSTKALLEKSLGTASNAFRVYLGFAGWAPGQLEYEVELDTWHIFRGDAGMVFDPDPDSLWSRLIRRTELRIAMAAAGVN